MKQVFYRIFCVGLAVSLLSSCGSSGRSTDDESATSADSAYDIEQDGSGESALPPAEAVSAEGNDGSVSENLRREAPQCGSLSPEDEAYEAGHSQGYDDGSADAETGQERGTSFNEGNDYSGAAADQYEEGYNAGYDEGFSER